MLAARTRSSYSAAACVGPSPAFGVGRGGGDNDRANPLPYAEEWQRRIKGAALKLMPGGHMLIHENPAAAADVVTEFLK